MRDLTLEYVRKVTVTDMRTDITDSQYILANKTYNHRIDEKKHLNVQPGARQAPELWYASSMVDL